MVALRDAEEAMYPASRFATPDYEASLHLSEQYERMTADAMADGADPRRVNEWMRGE
jgi:hypothetical protein